MTSFLQKEKINARGANNSCTTRQIMCTFRVQHWTTKFVSPVKLKSSTLKITTHKWNLRVSLLCISIFTFVQNANEGHFTDSDPEILLCEFCEKRCGGKCDNQECHVICCRQEDARHGSWIMGMFYCQNCSPTYFYDVRTTYHFRNFLWDRVKI